MASAAGLTNTLPRSSCGKCVKVLQELISGLHDDKEGNISTDARHGNSHESRKEPPPLTLLRAIARSSQHHPGYDRWGQEKETARRRRTNTTLQRPSALKIEETEDGVRLIIPVETTAPALMKRWTQLEPPQKQQLEEQPTNDEQEDEAELEDLAPLATSVHQLDHAHDLEGSSSSSSSRVARTMSQQPQQQQQAVVVSDPLTIELRCRKCETTGPEAGARAFLMGPEPLSIVLCHNRIHSESHEIQEILTHELVHLYDVQTLELDLADCETVAYSEVRAAREAECSRGMNQAASAAVKQKSSLASNLKETFSEHVIRPYCVKSIALGATQNMFPHKGKACLHKVWEKAYADQRPFRREPATATAASDTKSTPRRLSGSIRGASER